MSQVVSIKWQTIVGDDRPEWVELTLASGLVVRYRAEGAT